MKKSILLATISALILIFLSSCSSGVSQEQYKKATDDLSSAQSQIQTLQSQLSSAQSQVQTLQTQVSSLQTQTQSCQSDLKGLTTKISKAKMVADLMDSIGQLYLSPSAPTTSQLANVYVQWANSVKAIDDPQLSAKFASLTNTSTESQGSQAAVDFIFYLFTLESKLLQ